MLDNKLIENALNLTGKTTEDMNVDKYIRTTTDGFCIFDINFSIEKFCYYLLSPEFIAKFNELPYYEQYPVDIMAKTFGKSIYEYQSGNEKPLIELLLKIKPI